MPEQAPKKIRREDASERLRRDVERRRRRAPNEAFWRAVALTGSVGWPIVLLATGGALLGHYLDNRWHSGVRFTLMLLAIGTTLGTWIAFRTVKDGK